MGTPQGECPKKNAKRDPQNGELSPHGAGNGKQSEGYGCNKIPGIQIHRVLQNTVAGHSVAPIAGPLGAFEGARDTYILTHLVAADNLLPISGLTLKGIGGAPEKRTRQRLRLFLLDQNTQVPAQLQEARTGEVHQQIEGQRTAPTFLLLYHLEGRRKILTQR